jgi:Transposase DDE domain
VPEGTGRLQKQGRFSREDFSYDGTADAYRCPAGELLHPMKGRKKGRLETPSGRLEIRYAIRKAICAACQLRTRCLGPRAAYRTIARWEHEDVLERHRARMQGADQLMRRRSAIVEHPFGTIKCRAGYRHFLVRGFNKVRGEWSLMALCYNFTRVLNILGFEGFVAGMAKAFRSPLAARPAPVGCLQLLLDAFSTNIPVRLLIRRFGLSPVG